MSEYTLTSVEMRDQYIAGAMVTGFAYSRAEARAVFNRWLAGVQAEALEEAASVIDRLDDGEAEMYNEDLNATPVTFWLRKRADQIRGAS